MKAYAVGGSVRDELLGLPAGDRDFVVVGATPEEMAAAGYRPVGADFPVFLHPETHEEYALARTERKTAPGYRGFTFHASPDVTLEEDLRRRDLTINAMARREDGTLVDPHGGERDLRAKVLRHVSEAFAEDPVRILRLARFAARFGFSVAEETQALLRRMVQAGEADALVPERVWQELSRGLMEKQPATMLRVLADCGALARILPEVDGAWSSDGGRQAIEARLACAATRGHALPVRFAALVLDMPEDALARLATRVNLPGEPRDIARVAIRERDVLGQKFPDADSVLALLERADAFRRPDRLDRLLEIAACDAGCPDGDFPPARPLRAALAAARAVDAGAVAKEFPQDVPGAVRRAREMAIAQLQPTTGN